MTKISIKQVNEAYGLASKIVSQRMRLRYVDETPLARFDPSGAILLVVGGLPPEDLVRIKEIVRARVKQQCDAIEARAAEIGLDIHDLEEEVGRIQAERSERISAFEDISHDPEPVQ